MARMLNEINRQLHKFDRSFNRMIGSEDGRRADSSHLSDDLQETIIQEFLNRLDLSGNVEETLYRIVQKLKFTID